MFGIDALVALFIGLLGLITRTYLERKDAKDAGIEAKNETFREHLAESDAPAVHADLASLHDRVREAVCDDTARGNNSHLNS